MKKKNLSRNLSYTCLVLLFFSIYGFAQITITSDEWPSTLGYSMVDYIVEDATGSGIPVNIGNAGGPQTWTFATVMFPGGYDFTSTIVEPSTAPHISSFPTSNNVWHINFNTGGIVFDGNIYYNLSGNSLDVQGMAASQGPFNFFQDFTPDDLRLPFPATFNSSWYSNFSYSFEPITGTVIFDSLRRTSTVDAWGTINLPTGSFDCLRIRSEEIEITAMYINGQLTDSDTTARFVYAWGGENTGLLAEVISLDNETNPNFTQAKAVRLQSSVTGIEDQTNKVNNTFQLHQNYPNPFNPVTNIRFGLPKASRVKIEVYNTLGQRVAELLNEQKPAGYHKVQFDGSNLASGVYFYKIEAVSFVQVKKMLLVQ